MRFREVLGLAVMGAWVALGVWAMNQFGFQHHLHDALWSLGAAIALLIILVVGVAIFFVVAKESPWVWFNSSSDD